MARRTAAGWVPKQHGAWAMIVVPYVTGLVLAERLRPLDWGDATLGLTWLVGHPPRCCPPGHHANLAGRRQPLSPGVGAPAVYWARPYRRSPASPRPGTM